MGNSGEFSRRTERDAAPRAWEPSSLHSASRGRKYLNAEECRWLRQRAEELPEDRALLVLTMLHSGGRVSEVLALRRVDFDLAGGMVAIRTLKRRRFHVREVPLPPELLRRIDRCFGLRIMEPGAVLWPLSRTTAWRIVRGLLAEVGVTGSRACPKALRHAFGIRGLHARVPLTVIRKWLGHARLSTTEIYLDVVGPDEKGLARRMWRAGCGEDTRRPPHASHP